MEMKIEGNRDNLAASNVFEEMQSKYHSITFNYPLVLIPLFWYSETMFCYTLKSWLIIYEFCVTYFICSNNYVSLFM